ncbi:hypothetical protein [Tautonia marina]|uniref:hypothetical protein n=1 Tax=Tautonia marina TaxID=2653855 RepID=UPI001261156E|nr:hypothetical protein [Tautonia marina]
MSRTIQGLIQGKTIALEAEPGLADGQRVEVTIRPLIDPDERKRRLAALAGSLAYLPEEEWESLDAIVHERQQWSHRERPG